MKDVSKRIEQLVEDLRVLPRVQAGNLRVTPNLEIRWNQMNNRIHQVYRMEFDERDWNLEIPKKVRELTYSFLDVELEDVLEEVELALSSLLEHLRAQQGDVVGVRKKYLIDQINELQEELKSL